MSGVARSEHDSGGSTTWWDRLAGGFLLLVLVSLALVRAELGTRLDGFTIDEPWHIVAGASYARTGDYRINPEHPPLVKRWVGAWMPETLLPLPPLQVVQDKPQERELVEATVFASPDVDAVQERARRAAMALNAVLLMALALVCWRALGLAVAVVLLALVLVEPTLLAHLPLVMTDLPVALTLLLAAVACGMFVWRWQWRWALGAGVAIGLALASKHSALPGIAALGVALLAMVLLNLAASGWREAFHRAVKLAVVVVVSGMVVWAGYGFQFTAGPDGSDHYNRTLEHKLDDLQSPAMAQSIRVLDRSGVLPRPYLWGLADTVRAGVDGRGQAEHRLWGVDHAGRPPAHAWPSLVLSKLPLALAVLLLVGGVALAVRLPVSARARSVLAMVLVMAAGYALALLLSKGTYAGVRHALPVLMAMLLLAAVGLSMLWRREGRARVPGMALAAGVWALAVATTLGEPRLYEFHNTLAGGNVDAWRNFRNESVDLGQRIREVARFHDEVVVGSGQPLYLFYRVGEPATRHYLPGERKLVESIHDEHALGEWEGWFVFPMPYTEPEPRSDWDPAEIFANLELVQRFGHVGVWQGRLNHPRMWAGSMSTRVWEYIYQQGGDDWALVARRLDQVLALNPHAYFAAFELGNARLRLGEREAAVAAYRRLLEQDRFPMDPDFVARLSAHVQIIEQSSDLAHVSPMRSPFLE